MITSDNNDNSFYFSNTHTYSKKNSYKRKKRNTDPHKNRTLTLIFTDNHCIPPFLLIETLSSESILCRLKGCYLVASKTEEGFGGLLDVDGKRDLSGFDSALPPPQNNLVLNELGLGASGSLVEDEDVNEYLKFEGPVSAMVS